MDERKIEAFAEHLMGQLTSALTMLSVYLGLRLGLFQAMVDEGALNSAELAAHTGCVDRYVREWLMCMAVCDYVSYDSTSGKYTLPPECAVVLLDQDNPAYGAASTFAVPSLAGVLPILM